jgi:hypothetical protein
VYVDVDGSASWYAISECLWSTTTDIKGRVTLNHRYGNMENFFVKFLGVCTLTLEMVVDKLAEQGEERTSIGEIKDTIRELNALLQSEEEHPSPDRILRSNVFPIRYPNGGVKLCSSGSDFGIPDRQHLSELFFNRSMMLDFDINEVPRLEPFFQWTGLMDRYLSSCVKEISYLSGDSDRLLESPERDLGRKAHGLLR